MARVFVLAALVLLLAACERDDSLGAFAESRVPPSLGPRFYPPDGWAWGLIQTGSTPAQRYGVASPPRVPRAVVVILPGYGESAEVWFETAHDLLDRGYTVWILDRAGQGGSERYGHPRDMGSLTSFDPDVANLRGLLRRVVRPEPEVPVVLVSHADGAVTALRALQTGFQVDGMVAASPALAPPGARPSTRGLLRRLGLGRLAGEASWSREAPDDHAAGRTHDPWRGKVRQAWQTANPDLRMAEPAAEWRSAYAVASRSVETEAGRLRTPILMLNPTAAATGVCRRAAACETHQIAGARAALHLEADPWRSIFIQEVSAFTNGLIVQGRSGEQPSRNR